MDAPVQVAPGVHRASLRVLRDLPVELVLPSHGEPFHDLAGRVDAILAHHRERLDGLAALLERPATAWELTGRLFGPMPADLLLHAFRATTAGALSGNS